MDLASARPTHLEGERSHSLTNIEVRLKNSFTVVIPIGAYKRILRYRQTSGSETGGVIVGFVAPRNRLVLQRFMPPSNRNRASRSWLERDLTDAQAFVNAAYRDTGGKLNYVGEWHTHPEGSPSPSGSDISMLGDMLRNSQLELDFLIGVILGNTGRIRLWSQSSKQRLGSVLLTPDYRV
jgi:integrative and conjugative element protein (TIGR02256 family)